MESFIHRSIHLSQYIKILIVKKMIMRSHVATRIYGMRSISMQYTNG